MTREFQLIDEFVRQCPHLASPAGPGDDCAVLRGSHFATCVTTDALVEGVHFTRKTFSLEDIGHKALAVNLSDLAAMGARPAWMLVALGLPASITASDVRRLGQGVGGLALTHQVLLAGGNLARSPVLTLTLTLAGTVASEGAAWLRSTAAPGDALYVSGALGSAAGGVEVLAKKASASFPSLAQAQRRPTPHLAWARAAHGTVAAAIDVSDGLLQDLAHLCVASRVGAEVETAAIPLEQALMRWRGPEHALSLALTGGEDYVVLVAVRPAKERAFLSALKRHNQAAFRIGALTRKKGIRVDGVPFTGRGGFDHFASLRNGSRSRRSVL